ILEPTLSKLAETPHEPAPSDDQDLRYVEDLLDRMAGSAGLSLDVYERLEKGGHFSAIERAGQVVLSPFLRGMLAAQIEAYEQQDPEEVVRRKKERAACAALCNKTAKALTAYFGLERKLPPLMASHPALSLAEGLREIAQAITPAKRGKGGNRHRVED